MMGTKQPVNISMTITEIGGAVKHSMGIVNPFRADKENWTDPNIQPTIAHFKQETVPGHSDRNHFTLRILIVVLIFPYPGDTLITALG